MAEDPDKALHTVRSLIQRTVATTPRPEGESAAYRACALIRKHGLEVVDPSEIDEILRENEELKQKVLQLEAGLTADDLVAMTRAAQALGAQVAQAANTAHVAASAAVSPPMRDPATIRSKYRGHCKHCGKTYHPDDYILWRKNVGTWCEYPATCYDQWLAARSALQNFAAAVFP